MRFPPVSRYTALSTGLLLGLWAGSSMADNVINENTIIDGSLCLGAFCADPETYVFQTSTLRFEDFNAVIQFDDQSSPTSGYPSNDWALLFNDNTPGGENRFSIEDTTAGVSPFTIEAGARENALRVKADGKIGLGTAFPYRPLHIAAPGYPAIRLEQTSVPWVWDIVASDNSFVIVDVTAEGTGGSNIPFQIQPGAENSAMRILNTGVIRLKSQVLVARNDGAAQVKVEETSATTAPRTLLDLQNNGRPEIVMGNTNTGGEWSFGAGTNFILKQGAVGSASSAKTKLFEVEADGDATLAGSLTTGGTTCGGGCDLVFNEDYDLPTISEHAAQMFTLGHLPNVGPTVENQPINVTDKLGRMLNELEHAHIYIAKLEAELNAVRAGHAAEIAALSARLAALETQ